MVDGRVRRASEQHQPANTPAPVTASLTNTVRPSTIVAAAAPRSSQPSNGVFFDFERSDAARTVTRASGASTVMSASAPGASVPPSRAQDAGRVQRQQLDEPRQGDETGVHEPIEDERHARLEPDDAERGAVELDLLLVRVVRRMIGGDHVDGAVAEPADHRRRRRRPRAAAGSSCSWCRT